MHFLKKSEFSQFSHLSGSIGPITVMVQFKDTFGTLSPTIQGLVVSSILLPAAASSIAAGPLSDRISRTRTFSIGGAIFAAGAVLECASPNLATLLVGRCISGIGEGLFLSILTVYVCEIAPTAIRGRLSCIVQLYITIGVAAGAITLSKLGLSF
jgi:MFS family permease